MDARLATDSDDPVILTGCGHVISAGEPCDPSPYLKAPKLRKYMGIQDDLAVVAAARALQSAGFRSPSDYRAERIGLYLVVGGTAWVAPVDGCACCARDESDLKVRAEDQIAVGATAGQDAGLAKFRFGPAIANEHVAAGSGRGTPSKRSSPWPAG